MSPLIGLDLVAIFRRHWCFDKCGWELNLLLFNWSMINSPLADYTFNSLFLKMSEALLASNISLDLVLTEFL